MNLHDIYLIFS